MTTEELIAAVKDRSWFIAGTPGSPILFATTGNDSAWRLVETFGVDYHHILYLFSDGKGWMHYDEEDLARVADAYYALIRDIPALERLIESDQSSYRATAARARAAAEASPGDGFASVFTRTAAFQSQLAWACGSVGHAIEGISFGSEKRLRAILEKRGLQEPELLSALSAPTATSFMSEASRLLWRVKKAQGAEQDRLAKEFLKRYRWIENSYAGSAHLTLGKVLARAAEMAAEPHATDFHHAALEKERIMRELSFDESERFIVMTIDRCFAWQDLRKTRILESLEAFDTALEMLADALGIGLPALRCLMPEEFTLERLEAAGLADELEKRRNGAAFYCLPSGPSIFTGETFRSVVEALHEPIGSESELMGMSASKGVARGLVRVCESLADIAAAQEGEILVASMTRPEYMPAMRKAAAFVTDEGGITSHAAIVAREMKKPCVIGTKIATRFFKTGDLVEIDAEKGIVRIIERAKHA
jgi:phosphohistidine swiveling domain-containing protein